MINYCAVPLPPGVNPSGTALSCQLPTVERSIQEDPHCNRHSIGYHSDFTGGSEYSGLDTCSGDSGFTNAASYLKVPIDGHQVLPAICELEGDGNYYKSLHLPESSTSATKYCQITWTTEPVDGDTDPVTKSATNMDFPVYEISDTHVEITETKEKAKETEN